MMEFISGVQWREPVWLWGLLWPLLATLLQVALQRWRAADFVAPALWPWMRLGRGGGGRRWLWNRAWLVWLAWVCLVLALAGPRSQDRSYTAEPTALRDIMLVVDTSLSMAAADLSPSRLQLARWKLDELLARDTQSRYGLVVYAARPHLLAPVTHDRAALRSYLSLLDSSLLPTQGSDLLAALRFAASQWPPDDPHPHALLLVGDGEDWRDAAGFEAEWRGLLAELQARHLSVYALGVGGEGGVNILAPGGGWLSADGVQAVTRLQSRRLQSLTESSGGGAVTVTAGSDDIDALLHHWRRDLALAAVADHGHAQQVWVEHHRPLLWLGLLAWWLSLLLRLPAAAVGRVAAWLLAFTTLAGVVVAPPARADDGALWREAYAAYQQHDYERALQRYRQLSGYAARMGEASAAYGLARYGLALQHYTLALLAAQTEAERASALFNLANTYYRQGDYHHAVATYSDVLRYAGQHPAAAHNLAIAQALLAAVEERAAEARTRQAGRGPRSALAEEGMDLSNSSVSLAEEASTAPPAYAVPGTATEVEQLIERGIRYSRLAATAVAGEAGEEWYYEVSDLAGVAALANRRRDEEAGLWRRLFEQEEGYAAPLSEAQALPGVVPW